MIANQRHLFDFPDEVAYLNCAYMSPLMKIVQEEGRKGIAAKARPWQLSPPDFFTRSDAARKAFARIIGAKAKDIAIIPSVSYGISLAAKNLTLNPGKHILCLEDQFPSNIYPWRRMAADNGASLHIITRKAAASPEGTDWTPAILDAITDDTAIIALPHCHWTDGSLIDLVKVGEKARRHGSALVLDITQSGGALPFDTASIQPDFAVCATYKWLLGPYSLGFAYIAPKWQTGIPLEEGWIARAGSENFARLVDYQDVYQPGAQRFDMGERSNFHLLPMALTALEQILEWGVKNIQQTLSIKTGAIAERAAAMGLACAPLRLRAGHFLGLRFAGGVPEDLLPALAAENIFVSVRGDSMRVTPHLYNTDEDIEKLFKALAPYAAAPK